MTTPRISRNPPRNLQAPTPWTSRVLEVLWLLAVFLVLDKLTPKISFIGIEGHPEAIGLYVFGYLVFFGLVLHAALTSPL